MASTESNPIAEAAAAAAEQTPVLFKDLPGKGKSIVSHGAVLKKVITAAPEGAVAPKNGQKVSVHYTGTLAAGGAVFDSSRQRKQVISFVLGRGKVIKGWDLGIATMKVGERASLRIKSAYAYGDRGHPPKIPAGASLDFDIQLLDAQDLPKPVDPLTYHIKKFAEAKEKHGADADHAEIAEALTNLGQIFLQRNNLAQARAYHEKALAMKQRVNGNGEDSADGSIASSLYFLGIIAMHQNELEKSLDYHTRSLKMKSGIYLGENGNGVHPELIVSHTGLGILYLKMDEVAAARRHLDSAFAMCRVVHGGTVNRETATALHNLGRVALAEKKYPTARSYFSNAVQLRHMIHGGPHAEIASSLNNLGNTCFLQGDLKGAERFLEQALRIQVHVAGPKSASGATMQQSLNTVRQLKTQPKWQAKMRRYAKQAKESKGLQTQVLDTAQDRKYQEQVAVRSAAQLLAAQEMEEKKNAGTKSSAGSKKKKKNKKKKKK